MTEKNKAWLFDLFIIALLAILGFCTYGLSPLMTPDEGRYGELAREMLVHGQYIIPHLDNLAYFDKPPLVYWLTALSIHWFGSSEWGARFWPMALSVISLFYTYYVIRSVYNRKLGLYTTIVFGSCFLFLIQGHDLTMDFAVAFFINCCLLTFWLCIHCFYEKKSTRFMLLTIAYILMGCAVMTKGLIGIVFPVAILGLWLLIHRKWRMILELQPILGLIIVIIISVPWLVLAQRQYPDFLHYYIWVQQFERYLTPVLHRETDRKFYIPLLLAMIFPWTAFWWRIFANIKQLCLTYSFFVIWAGFIIVFYAFSNSLLIPYLLPAILPLALLVAVCFIALESTLVKQHKVLHALQLIVMFVGAAALLFIGITHSHHHIAAVFPGVLFLLMFLWVLYAYYEDMTYKTLFMVIVVLFLIAQNIIFINIDIFAKRSLKQIGQYMHARRQENPNIKLFVLFGYYQDLPYYYNHSVDVVVYHKEYPTNLLYSDRYAKLKHDTIFNVAQFKKVWETKPAYAVISNSRLSMLNSVYPGIHYCKVLYENRFWLLSNTQHCINSS